MKLNEFRFYFLTILWILVSHNPTLSILIEIQLTSFVSASNTILLSFGTRPVRYPELHIRAPVSVMLDGPTVGSGDSICSGNIAYSYNSATLKAFYFISIKNLRGVINDILASDSKCFKMCKKLLSWSGKLFG